MVERRRRNDTRSQTDDTCAAQSLAVRRSTALRLEIQFHEQKHLGRSGNIDGHEKLKTDRRVANVWVFVSRVFSSRSTFRADVVQHFRRDTKSIRSTVA